MLNVFGLKDAKKAISRILEAIEKKEKIILFGDNDLDGAVSVTILKEALEMLGGIVSSVYFADRERYGYGLSSIALDVFMSEAPALLILLDTGTGNFEGIEKANKAGFSVIVIDHHKLLGGLPGAYAIVNPKQEGEEHCLRELCAGGLTYKLVGALFSSAQRAFEPEQFLELAMLATIFDRVPMTEINKKIVEQGILVLPRTERKGLRVLMDASGLELFDEQAICQKIISPLSAANCKNHKNKAFLLLTECVSGRAKKAAEELLERSRKKKEGVREIIQEIEDRGDLSASIVFEGDRDWTLALAGTVSSRICQEYRRPVFIYHRGEKHSQGSVRTPKEIDAIELMASCSGLLLNYGGHPRAAGFGLDNENIEAFKSCLIENLKKIESQILNVI